MKLLLYIKIHKRKTFLNPQFLSSIRCYYGSSATASISPPSSYQSNNSSSNNNDSSSSTICGILQNKDFLRKSDPNSTTPTTGLHVLDLINKGSLRPDSSLYSSIIKRCTELSKLKEGRIVHSHFLHSRFSDNVVVLNSILNMYAKLGCLDEARKVFDDMGVKDMVTWTILITGYSQNDEPERALVLFPEMLRLGYVPNQFTFASLIKAAAAVGDGEVCGRQLHALCLKHGHHLDVYVGSALVDMYARCRVDRMDEARLVFDGLASKNEVSWNALIAGHTRRNEGDEALKVFVRMQREEYKATHFTYSSIFSACAGTGALEQGKWVHAHMIKSGGELKAYVGNTLIDMYAKSGSVDDAQKVFDRLLQRDAVSWNSMLTGFAQHGLAKETIRWFEGMLKIGVEPNEVTFLCVLTACSHAGLLDEGQHYFQLMTSEYKIQPDISHYVTMVYLLGRAGRIDQAKQFITEMPIEPTAAVFIALLGACRMHKNMEMGIYAAKRVFELDPYDSGPHIILYNVYASAGKWKEASEVRRYMKEIGVKKEPACSWVEIENAVHVFVANDDAHPQRDEIRQTWEQISDKIKRIGYVPDTSHVLLYVDEQEREAKLQYHSEKLALAFALINTPSGSTIRIMKNIRICGDCHSAIKFVSKAVQRQIIVRDTNRFHHFSDGSCSCGDYW